MLPDVIRLIFFVVSGSLAVAAHVYLYRRLVRDVTERVWVRRLARWALIVLGVCSLLVRPVARVLGGALPGWVFAPLLLWLGFLMYLLMLVLASHGAMAAWRFSRRKVAPPVSPERRAVLARGVAAGSALMSGGLASFGTWTAFHEPKVSEVPVVLAGLPKALDGFTIVQLTDIHVGALIQRRFMDELVARTNALKADLVAVTGDLVDGPPEQLGHAVAALQNLRAPRGSYFITGNHDYYSGADPWVHALEGLGLNVLRNRRVEIGDAGASFDLLGVDDWSARGGGDRWVGRSVSGYDLERAVAGRDLDRASVLLAHQPTNLPQASKHRIGLQLSGHTHGGQMFPATGIAQLMWGDRATGLSRQGNTWLYVSRGCGFVGPPMRVGSPPEIVKVTLVAG